MAKYKSLVELFDRNKQELIDKLSTLVLPNDMEKIQEVCSSFFDKLLSLNHDFRQSLTSSEDEMLKCVIDIIKAQSYHIPYSKEDVSLSQLCDKSIANDRTKVYATAGIGGVVAAGSAALSGASLLGTMLTFALGTFLVGFIAYFIDNRKVGISHQNNHDEKVKYTSVNTLSKEEINTLVSYISTMCKGIDSFIHRYKSDIAEVINGYEERLQAKVFEKQYPAILESLQAMFGKMHTSSDKELPLYVACENVASTLESLGYTHIVYSPQLNNDLLFKKRESDYVSEVQMYLPAIMRGENIILQGLIFIPRKK